MNSIKSLYVVQQILKRKDKMISINCIFNSFNPNSFLIFSSNKPSLGLTVNLAFTMRQIFVKLTLIRNIFVKFIQLRNFLIIEFCNLWIVKCPITFLQIIFISSYVLIFVNKLKSPHSIFHTVFKLTFIGPSFRYQDTILVMELSIDKSSLILKFQCFFDIFGVFYLPCKITISHLSILHGADKNGIFFWQSQLTLSMKSIVLKLTNVLYFR